MGWSRGSELLSKLEKSFRDNVKEAPQNTKFWVETIEAFEDLDCDNVSDCLNQYVSVSFRRAVYELYPWQHGYDVACGERDIRVYPKPGHKNALLKWEEGYRVGVEDSKED